MSQLYRAGLLRENQPPIYLTGPLPRHEADDWARNANGAVIVLPWPASPEEDEMATQTRRATYEDVLNAPPNLRAEILEGRLVLMPRPAARHAFAAARLMGLLEPPFTRGVSGPGGWIILPEPELHFGKKPELEVADPDLAGWRIERMPKPPETAYFAVVPDWTCEIISPSSENDDRIVKPRIYAKFGVSYYWLADPRKHTLETFVSRNGELKPAETFRDAASVAAPPFHEISFSLGELWWD